MKRNKKILVIVICVVLAVVLWCIGYFTLKNYYYSKIESGIFKIVQEHIINDENFIEKYGTPISLEQDENNKMEILDNDEKSECYIWCIVEVESGAVYRVQVKFGTAEYSVEYQNIDVVSIP